MDRHVIKGRGKHRGMYLTYGRLVGLPTNRYGWTPKQKDAARWEEPGYALSKYPSILAEKHNGYFVKLVAPPAIVARVDELKAFIGSHADASRRPSCYWFDSDFQDMGGNFCRDCAEKLVDEKYASDPAAFEDCETAEERYRAAIDGGFDTDHDSTPYCEACKVELSGSLTEHGADQTIEALTSDIVPTFDNASGWRELDDATINLCNDDPRWRAIARAVDAAVEAERKHDAKMEELARSPGMPEARTGFLALLAARAEQKAPEPSYRLWGDLLAWLKIPYKERKAQPDREKPLVEEAKVFARALGWRAYWQGGSFIIDAPYGGYYWPWVVKTEQYRLWQPKAFQEGAAAYMLDRDANPYPEDTEEHSQWDCGLRGGIFTRP